MFRIAGNLYRPCRIERCGGTQRIDKRIELLLELSFRSEKGWVDRQKKMSDTLRDLRRGTEGREGSAGERCRKHLHHGRQAIALVAALFFIPSPGRQLEVCPSGFRVSF